MSDETNVQPPQEPVTKMSRPLTTPENRPPAIALPAGDCDAVSLPVCTL